MKSNKYTINYYKMFDDNIYRIDKRMNEFL